MLTYYIPEHGETPKDACELRKLYPWRSIPSDPKDFAEAAAEYCQSCRDGWEWSWPVTFVVLSDGVEAARFSVEREMVPEFSAAEVRSNTMGQQRPAEDSAQQNVRNPGVAL